MHFASFCLITVSLNGVRIQRVCRVAAAAVDAAAAVAALLLLLPLLLLLLLLPLLLRLPPLRQVRHIKGSMLVCVLYLPVCDQHAVRRGKRALIADISMCSTTSAASCLFALPPCCLYVYMKCGTCSAPYILSSHVYRGPTFVFLLFFLSPFYVQHAERHG
jgi:hypothetical protein